MTPLPPICPDRTPKSLHRLSASPAHMQKLPFFVTLLIVLDFMPLMHFLHLLCTEYKLHEGGNTAVPGSPQMVDEHSQVWD